MVICALYSNIQHKALRSRLILLFLKEDSVNLLLILIFAGQKSHSKDYQFVWHFYFVNYFKPRGEDIKLYS